MRADEAEKSALVGAVDVGIGNTDPRATPVETVTGKRTTQFLAPAADKSKVAPYAADWAADIDAPLTSTVAAFPA